MAAGRPNLYLAANDSFCQLAGYSWAELTGREFLGDFHPEEQAALDAAIQQIAVSGDCPSVCAKWRLIRKDGETDLRPRDRRRCPAASGERYLTAFFEDVSPAEQSAAEMSQLRHELARSHRAKSLGHLVDGIAHDFNNLLMVIESYASLVHEQVSIAEAADSATRWRPVRSDIEQIQDASERAKMLIRHMLAFARRASAPGRGRRSWAGGERRQPLLGGLLGEHITPGRSSDPGAARASRRLAGSGPTRPARADAHRHRG